jgi:CHASE3 domain sensor protein
MGPDAKKTDITKKEKAAARDINTIKRDVKRLEELRTRLSVLNTYFADEETRKKSEINISPMIEESIKILDRVVASLEPMTKKSAPETSVLFQE